MCRSRIDHFGRLNTLVLQKSKSLSFLHKVRTTLSEKAYCNYHCHWMECWNTTININNRRSFVFMKWWNGQQHRHWRGKQEKTWFAINLVQRRLPSIHLNTNVAPHTISVLKHPIIIQSNLKASSFFAAPTKFMSFISCQYIFKFALKVIPNKNVIRIAFGENWPLF